MNKPSKLFIKYAAIIDRGFITEREIISFRSAVNRWKRTTMSENEKQQLIGMMFDKLESTGGFDLETAQKQKGIDWLRNKLYTKTGKRRQDVFARGVPDHVFKVVDNFKDFTLVDFESVGFSHQLFPVYRCIAQDGTSFDYVGKQSITLELY